MPLFIHTMMHHLLLEYYYFELQENSTRYCTSLTLQYIKCKGCYSLFIVVVLVYLANLAIPVMWI